MVTKRTVWDCEECGRSVLWDCGVRLRHVQSGHRVVDLAEVSRDNDASRDNDEEEGDVEVPELSDESEEEVEEEEEEESNIGVKPEPQDLLSAPGVTV